MFFNGDIKFKGISSSTYSLIITAVPSITHSEIRGEVFTIPGRDGDLLSNDPYRGDAEVRVQFAMVNNNGTSGYQTALREVRQWLDKVRNKLFKTIIKFHTCRKICSYNLYESKCRSS